VQYKDQIKEMEEHAVPTTPPEVRAQREKDTIESTKSIAHVIYRMIELLEKSGELWTQLLEYGILQDP
jgi:hypothetical protein